MPGVQSSIELPTKRHSFINPKPFADVDIHDPQWIPILHPISSKKEEQQQPAYLEKEVSPYNTSTFSAFSDKAASKLSLSHAYSKSSLAPESVAKTESQTETSVDSIPPLPALPPSPAHFELPAARPTSAYFQHKSITQPKVEVKEGLKEEAKEDATETTDTDGTTESSMDQSTMGTASLIEEQTYSLPAQQVVKDGREDLSILPPLPLSATSSISSVRKSVAPPTSKYNRKPLPSTPGRTPTPSGSPRMSTITASPSPTAMSEQVQHFQPMQSPKPSAALGPSPLANNIHHSMSTASMRRQRALHSHPSNTDLNSRPNSSSSDSEPTAAAPPPRPRSRPSSQRRRRSTESRIQSRNASHTSLTLPSPTPAPNTKIPRLPPHALTSDDALVDEQVKPPPEAHLRTSSRRMTKGDHTELASFMTTHNEVIFRRFDDVHVQLLLCLQDEISQLESELLEIDGASMTRNDRTMERMRIIRELRRVVGEYDNLFASWSAMQANKASKSTTQSLRKWLERPGTSAGQMLGQGAKEDLMWLDSSKDLSAVNLGPSKPLSEELGESSKSGTGGKGGGGFAALFAGCTGKRK